MKDTTFGRAGPNDLQSARILIVEDNVFLADAIAITLEYAGARIVGPFPNMIDALENLSELTAIDGAVLDVGLGDQNSYPLADALQLTGVPFLFLTGHDKSKLPPRFANAHYMQKPFTDAALVQALIAIGLERVY